MSPELRLAETRKITEFITKNWDKPTSYLSNQLGLSPSSVRRWRNRIKNNKIFASQIIANDKDNARAQIASLSKELKDAREQLKLYQNIVEARDQLNDASPNLLKTKFVVDPKKQTATEDRSILTFVLSDWHIEETVEPESVNYVNEFNQNVAKARVEKLAFSMVKLYNLFKQGTHIESVVVALLGDFFTSNIHDELVETTTLRPVDAALWAQAMLSEVLRYLRAHIPDDVNIIVQCASGNHSRITKKTHYATEQGNSLEHFMYHALADSLKDLNMKFNIPRSYLSTLDYYGSSIRFHHGHAIKFQGGVGGITIPINKAKAQWDKSGQAALDVFGHFHQFMDGGNFLVNGSLIGYSAYAVAIKAAYEPPRQAAFLWTKGRGKTIVAPIFVE